MPEPLRIAAVVATRFQYPPGRGILVELRDQQGGTGLCRTPDSAGMLERIWRLGSESVGTAVSDAGRRWSRAAPEAGWLADVDEWRAIGALETAALDLLARNCGVPLWLWLGGAWRPAVRVALGPRGDAALDDPPLVVPDGALAGIGLDVRGDPASPASLVPRPLGSWTEARNAILAGTVRAFVVDPLAAGGPAGVARLDAAARAFQLELAIAAPDASLFDQTLAIHLAFATRMATLPVQLPSAAEEDLDLYTTYTDFRRPGGLIDPPDRPGLGLDVRADVIERHTVERLVTGAVPERRP